MKNQKKKYMKNRKMSNTYKTQYKETQLNPEKKNNLVLYFKNFNHDGLLMDMFMPSVEVYKIALNLNMELI